MYDFEIIFYEVMEFFGISEWWNLFDSDLFAEVEKRIVNEYGAEVLESDIYLEWIECMAEDL